MQEDLAPESVLTSPRLRWLRAHDLVVRHYDGPHGCGGPECAGFVVGNSSRTRNAGGETEREAELAYAAAFGIEHYARAEWERAMGEPPGYEFD